MIIDQIFFKTTAKIILNIVVFIFIDYNDLYIFEFLFNSANQLKTFKIHAQNSQLFDIRQSLLQLKVILQISEFLDIQLISEPIDISESRITTSLQYHRIIFDFDFIIHSYIWFSSCIIDSSDCSS